MGTLGFTMGHQQTSDRSRRCQLTTALVCLLGLGNVVMGQGFSTWNPVKTTCNTALARGMVVGNTMYVDGGEFIDQYFYGDIGKPSRMGGVTPTRWQNKLLWELDLSQKFNVSRPPWTTYSKPDDWDEHYDGLSGSLWNLGDGRFYTLGGRYSGWEGPPPGQRIRAPIYTQNASGYYFQLPDPRMFAYDIEAGTWSSVLLPKGVSRVFDTAFTQSARNKVGYTLGGTLVKERDFSTTDFFAAVGDWVDTMSAYDFRTGDFNFTTLPDSIGQTTQVIMHSLDRVGKEGILVALAGRSKKDNIEQVRPMDEILIYDIGTSTWMKQKATGDIPLPRYRACSVLVPAPDLSSFQIYIFSGMAENDIFILDMYVLSIPAFTWTKIEMKNYPNEWPVADMTCGLYEERQFIIIPGEVNVTTAATGDDKWWIECNKDTAVHVFDTYDWEFKSEFDPDNKGPKVPTTIFNLVGGDDTGGATLKKPEAGWNYEALDAIFSTRNELPPEEKLPFPPASPSITTNPQMTKSNKNAVIGGAVGGACMAAFIVSILVFCIKRKRNPSLSESKEAELHGTGFTGELSGTNFIRELNETNYNYHRPYELPSHGPEEIRGEAVGSSTRE